MSEQNQPSACLSKPCEQMPEEMTLRASVFPCRPEMIQVMLGSKDGTFGIGAEGATLADAAENLFRQIERLGGIPKAMRMAGDNARSAGLIPIERDEAKELL